MTAIVGHFLGGRELTFRTDCPMSIVDVPASSKSATIALLSSGFAHHTCPLSFLLELNHLTTHVISLLSKPVIDEGSYLESAHKLVVASLQIR